MILCMLTRISVHRNSQESEEHSKIASPELMKQQRQLFWLALLSGSLSPTVQDCLALRNLLCPAGLGVQGLFGGRISPCGSPSNFCPSLSKTCCVDGGRSSDALDWAEGPLPSRLLFFRLSLLCLLDKGLTEVVACGLGFSGRDAGGTGSMTLSLTDPLPVVSFGIRFADFSACNRREWVDPRL